MNGGAAVALSRQAAASSLLVGLTTMAILFCSHFHQIEGDLSAGKMSPLVRLGPSRGFQVRCTSIDSCIFGDRDDRDD